MTLRFEDVRWDGLFPRQPSGDDLPPPTELHRGRSVLVTGAGGSIGAALSRAIHRLQPRTLLLLDSSEQNLYHIHRALNPGANPATIVPVLGSVADPNCLREVFQRYRPFVIYHAAALKHVLLGELNPFAVMSNNVFGTATLFGFAQEYGSERLIMISTDKSVNPISIMGASKRLAEIQLLLMQTRDTRMTSIRLGNVLGSEGSVVPLFLEQIARGGPVTVADPDVERYFLTMEATVGRVLAAVADCQDEALIAIPTMDEPVKIVDLARYLIAQAAAPEVAIRFTGLRHGDKLREEFVSARETAYAAECHGIQWFRSPAPLGSELAAGLAELDRATADRDLRHVLATLVRLVPEYQPSDYLRQQAEMVAT